MMYKYIKDSWNSDKELIKQRTTEWKKESATLKVERPTRLDKAREVGYRAKQGIIIVRQRVLRGGHRMRPSFSGGRKPRKMRRKKIVNLNYQSICEVRAQRHFKNMEVLNSYFVGKDKEYYWYEIIMIDPNHPALKSEFSWMLQNKKRVMHGKTSAQRRGRGLLGKGIGYEIKTR